MFKLYPIIFEFGKAAASPLTEDLINFYSYLASSIIQNEIQWGIKKDYSSTFFLTIPIDSFSPAKNPTILSLLTLERLEFYDVIDGNKKLKINNICILLDIRRTSRKSLLHHLADKIIQLLKINKGKNCKLIFFGDSIPSEKNILYKMLEIQFKSGNIFFIDTKFNHIPKSLSKVISKSVFFEKLNISKPNLADIVQRKLIRRLGNFPLPPGDVNFKIHRHYYDGEFCKEEISQLILNYLNRSNIVKSKLRYIIFYSPASPWFDLSIDILKAELLNKPQKFKKFKEIIKVDKISFKRILSKSETVKFQFLLLVPIIHSGNTFQYFYSAFRQQHPEIQSKNIFTLSLLNNIKKDTVSKESKRRLMIAGEEVFVDYLIPIQKDDSLPKDSEVVMLNLPTSPFEEDKYLKITSYDFWSLSEEVRYKEEDFVPDSIYRSRVKIMPNTIEWLNINAPYFAYKYDRYLRYFGSSSSRNRIIIIPDETKRKDKDLTLIGVEQFDTPSGRFAKCLDEIFHNTVISIPRRIIDQLINKEIELDDLKGIDELWIDNLRKLPRIGTKYCQNKVIICDEMFVRGGTFKSILHILLYFNIKPDYYFPLLNFNPNRFNLLQRENKDIIFLNLYEFQLKELKNV